MAVGPAADIAGHFSSMTNTFLSLYIAIPLLRPHLICWLLTGVKFRTIRWSINTVSLAFLRDGGICQECTSLLSIAVAALSHQRISLPMELVRFFLTYCARGSGRGLLPVFLPLQSTRLVSCIAFHVFVKKVMLFSGGPKLSLIHI